MRTDDLDFNLPPGLTAQQRAPDRAGPRLLRRSEEPPPPLTAVLRSPAFSSARQGVSVMPDEAWGQRERVRVLDGVRREPRRREYDRTRAMPTDDLDLNPPPELIAQQPAPDRAASRLLHYRRSDRSVAHRRFGDLPQLLRPGDLLVLNDARVLPARFSLTKPTGGHVEGLFLRQPSPRRWEVMLKNLGPPRADVVLRFADDAKVSARVIEQHDGGEYLIEVNIDDPAAAVLERVGRMPWPAYIKRDESHDARDAEDRRG